MALEGEVLAIQDRLAQAERLLRQREEEQAAATGSEFFVARCKLESGVLTDIPVANVWTPITFAAASWDNDSMWDPAFPTRITINTDGAYDLKACGEFLWFPPGDPGVRGIGIRISGGFIVVKDYIDIRSSGSSSGAWAEQLCLSCSTEQELVAGQYVEMVAYSGMAGDDIVAGVDYSPRLSARRFDEAS